MEARRFGEWKLARADEPERDAVRRPIESGRQQRAAEHENRKQSIAPEQPADPGEGGACDDEQRPRLEHVADGEEGAAHTA